MNVPSTRNPISNKELNIRNKKQSFNTTFFQTVNEGKRKMPKGRKINPQVNLLQEPSTSKMEDITKNERGSLLSKQLSSGSNGIVTSRPFSRSSGKDVMSSIKSSSGKTPSVHDILEAAGITDILMDEERNKFNVSFKLSNPSRPVESESFFVGLLDDKPQEVIPEVSQIRPDPADYVTPNKRRLVESVTSTVRSSNEPQSFAKKQGPLSESANIINPSKNSSPLFKIPSIIPSSSSARRKNTDLSYYDKIFHTPRNYTSLPKLTTPLLDPKALRREKARRESHSFDTSTSGSKRNKAAASKTGISSATISCDQTYVIIGIASGRGCATGEVGLAVLDLKRPSIILSQYCDSQTYQKTMAKINIYQPAEILIPDTLMSGDNNLFNTIKNYFEEVKLITVRRQCFNNEQGLTALRYLCHPEFSSVDLIIVNKYYCLCAAAAMIVYVELQHNITFAKQSLKVTYESAQGVVTIDLETVRRLELVTSETNSLQPDKYTLLGLMNHTLTLGGRRRLRTEILQPSSTQYKINERLDTVKYLVDNEESLIAIQKALSKFTSVERLLWMCASNKYLKVINTGVSESNSKNSTTLRGFEALINYILLLKQSVEDIPVLSEVLCEIKVEYFQNIREKLDDKRYETIREKIQQVLHDDSKPVRGYQAAELNRCFCVKEGINGLLDVARKTYSSLLDQLQELITGYSEETGLAMSLYLSSDLGFHAKFSLAKDYDLNARPLPSKFTSVKRKGNTYHITTDDLFSYNIRINKIIQEIQLISNAEILQLLDEIRASIGCVHNLCELISEIDAICSIAVASSQKDYVRPIFGSDLNVEAGRHPIMDKFQWNPTPNNVYATIDRNFNIITGPNMGGKTVYILQIALLQIMAQVGCFVPAYSAKFRVTDLIIVRKGLIDNLQCNASSFFIEIKEVMWTMKNTSDTSLIILDEICSGIDVNEGIAIAWAICEEFLQRPAFTFLATHYKFLTNLEKIYPNVKNYQMEALYEGNDTEFGPIVYTHRLIEGVTDVKHYGVRLLLQTSISNSIKQKAINYMKALKLERASALAVAKVMTPEEKKVRAQIEKVESFMKQLYEASLKDDFTTDVVRSFKQIAITEILNDGQDESNIQSTSVRVTELDDMSEESTSRKNKTVEDNAVDDVRITAGPSGTSLPARVLSYHTTSSSSKSAATF